MILSSDFKGIRQWQCHSEVLFGYLAKVFNQRKRHSSLSGARND